MRPSLRRTLSWIMVFLGLSLVLVAFIGYESRWRMAVHMAQGVLFAVLGLLNLKANATSRPPSLPGRDADPPQG